MKTHAPTHAANMNWLRVLEFGVEAVKCKAKNNHNNPVHQSLLFSPDFIL
jgi:hypothetical protein